MVRTWQLHIFFRMISFDSRSGGCVGFSSAGGRGCHFFDSRLEEKAGEQLAEEGSVRAGHLAVQTVIYPYLSILSLILACLSSERFF